MLLKRGTTKTGELEGSLVLDSSYLRTWVELLFFLLGGGQAPRGACAASIGEHFCKNGSEQGSEDAEDDHSRRQDVVKSTGCSIQMKVKCIQVTCCLQKDALQCRVHFDWRWRSVRGREVKFCRYVSKGSESVVFVYF